MHGLADKLVVFHVGTGQRGAAHQRTDLGGNARDIIQLARRAQRIGADERPDGAVVIDRLLPFLRPDHRTAGRPDRVRRQRTARTPGRQHVGQDTQRQAQQIDLGVRHRVRRFADVAHVLAHVLPPEARIDLLRQRIGPRLVLVRAGIAALAGQAFGQAQRLVVQHVGGQRVGITDEAHVLAGPVRIGLLAPVQERGLAAVQAHLRVEHHRAVLCQRALQRLPDLIGKRRIIQQVARGQEPHHAVAADRPAAAGPGVLRHEQAGRVPVARRRQLELQRLPGALRVQPRQRQIGGEADIAGPHIGPARAGLEALARHRPAFVERGIANRVHTVLVHLLLGQREQRVEHHAAGLAAHRHGRDTHLTFRRMQYEAAVGSGFGTRMAAVELQVGRLRGRSQRCPQGSGQANDLQHRSGGPACARRPPSLSARVVGPHRRCRRAGTAPPSRCLGPMVDAGLSAASSCIRIHGATW